MNFNPRSPHGERLRLRWLAISTWRISIHAPRTGSDHSSRLPSASMLRFQSTLPARGATLADQVVTRTKVAFQSTLPARGATSIFNALGEMMEFQSTLPARGATRSITADIDPDNNISIHAPRTGSDGASLLSRCPALDISIHAPRTGSDAVVGHACGLGADFNPRSPHGERPLGCSQIRLSEGISIHAPRTGSDLPSGWRNSPYNISIHAPRTGSD